MTPEEDKVKGEYSTYCIPTTEPVPLTKYSKFLMHYDMRELISIKGLEIVLELGEPVHVGVFAFIDPMWKFYYRVSNCTILLYGTALRDNIGDEISAKEHREDFLFTGYWTIDCSTFLDQVKEKLHLR